MNRILIIFSLLLSFHPGMTANPPQADTLKVFESSDSIVVIGNRIATSIRNLAYSYQTVSGQLVRQLSSHSALEMVDLTFPSAFVLENKVLGYGVGTVGAGTLNLRGLGGKPNSGVLVLLNGHPDFMGIFGHPLPDVYGNEDIDRLEILAGPSSTVFGDHALGGVVNLVTEPRYDHLATFHSEMGTSGTLMLTLSLQKRVNRHGFFFTIRSQKSDGHVAHTSFESKHVQGGWQYQFNKTWQLTVQGRYVPYQFDDPARGDQDKLNIGAYGKIRRATGEISLKNNGQRFKGAFQLYTNLGHHEFYDGFTSNDFSYGFSAYQFMQYSRTISLATGLDIINYGGKAKNDFAHLPNGAPIVNPDKHQLTSAGAYALLFYSPLPQLNLKAGLRYQHNSLPLNQFSPFAGISYTLARGVQAYVNYQTGFRAPTLMELYLFPSANAHLKNEQVQSIELGTAYQFSQTARLRLSVFKNKAVDLIQALPNATPPPPTRFVNGPNANQWGAEAMLKGRLLPGLFVQLSYGYLEPDVLTAYNPRHQFKYLIRFERNHFYANLFGKYVQNLYAGNDKQYPLPDYRLLNMQIGRSFEGANIYLRISNALNENYKARPDLVAPDRQIRVGLMLRIKG